MDSSLGTQLRHLIELLDGAVERSYTNMGLQYRARYTPVMRALKTGDPLTLGEVARAARITQPAASQTVSLMMKGGLVETVPSEDGRRKLLRLTEGGRGMLAQLQVAWDATAMAAESLDEDLTVPLSETLAAAIAALETKSFDERISVARSDQSLKGNMT